MLQSLEQPVEFGRLTDTLKTLSVAGAPQRQTGPIEDTPSFLQIVLQGAVLRQCDSPDGRVQTLAVYFPGDVINLGLYASGLKKGRDHLQALEGTVLGTVPYYALTTMRNDWKTSDIMARLLSRDLAISYERLRSMGRWTAVEAMAHFFCEVTLRCAQPAPEADRCSFPMSLQTLSTVLGISPVHANRALQNLRQNELADVVDRELIVHDFTGLAKLGDFDGGYLTSI